MIRAFVLKSGNVAVMEVALPLTRPSSPEEVAQFEDVPVHLRSRMLQAPAKVTSTWTLSKEDLREIEERAKAAFGEELKAITRRRPFAN